MADRLVNLVVNFAQVQKRPDLKQLINAAPAFHPSKQRTASVQHSSVILCSDQSKPVEGRPVPCHPLPLDYYFVSLNSYIIMIFLGRVYFRIFRLSIVMFLRLVVITSLKLLSDQLTAVLYRNPYDKIANGYDTKA